jgi:3-oxoacyl-[acyl-carrier-protein] synthase-1
LTAGKDFSAAPDVRGWPSTPTVPARVCRIEDETTAGSVEARMAAHLAAAWQMAARMAGRSPHDGEALGVVFASTKGSVEDSVWSKASPPRLDDTLTPVLRRFLATSDLQPRRTVCVSNACSSNHVALQLAGFWLRAGAVREVLVLSADHVGPFVVNGFAALRSLAPERVTPFAAGRQGIQLGEAAAALLVTLPGPAALCRIHAVDTRVEGHALTRSRESGATLEEACVLACDGRTPDVIVAHGTGTEANDAMEDAVYRRLFATVPVTCTKWSVGHTLGASGAVDLIAACEMLRRGEVFRIANTEAPDPAFAARYLTRQARWSGPPPARALVASVGFGGMHGAALVELA